MRNANIERNTKETQISISLELDGSGKSSQDVELPFFAHMLDQLAKHGCFDIDLKATGDLEVDAHHTVEDIGITMGEAFNQALGDKKGITRYGHAYAPLDEALSRVVIDFSGRPGLLWDVNFTKQTINDFDLQLLREFFQGFTNKSLATIHIDNLKGENAHHQAETIFKAFALALKQSCSIDEQKLDQIPSTKGSL
ncbi:MAG: imidazoleglycerol-phosphate dehydratase HisB [Pseudomonadota bacterium]|jgi:imidazoleglycerol-phosphate dehydratase|nr:imidazoleglycerol-phosphate dehydratase HisB [Pseudomonadota bacterium]|tara:strand:- start:424 stop:1011 length:588 start_codon:yes stop_codon:yes gene_type:complete